MGQVHAEIELVNAGDLILAKKSELDIDEIKRITVSVLVDTGAMNLSINENIQEYLQLPILDNRRFQMANGTVIECLVAGPVNIRFQNRQATCEAVVLPGDAEPLLGVIPMQCMDVIVDPPREQLVVNPKHPEYAVHRM